MYKNEFEKKIDEIKKSYLFWGEESYYIEKYSNLISKKIGKENSLVLYFEEYDYERAKNYLNQPSLFSDKNLLIIKSQKLIPIKELRNLISLTRKLPNSFLIFELFSNDGKKIAKEFEIDVRFFKPKEYEALNELASIAKELNLNIDSPALKHLLTILENNLSLAISELKKLALYPSVIDIKEIDSLVYAINPVSLEKFYIDLIEKKPLNELFEKIESQEINEIRVLLGLENFFLQLFLFHSYIRLHGKSDSKEILGYKLPQFIENERSQLAIKIKRYDKIFLALQECEYILKTKSDIEKKSILYSYLIKIQALI